MPSSAATSRSRSVKSLAPRIRASSGRYSSCTPSQSTPDMSGTQKSRRMIRPASAYACRHSATGSAWNRARDRSTVTTSPEEWSSSLLSDGMTCTSSRSLTTRRVPSPLTVNQSSSAASSLTSRLRRS